MNDINFPAGILQSPLYDSHASDASNYGHVGGIVGHELTHGFDDEGRQFDANGNLSDWWTPEDGKHFEEKADCEVKEYSNFVAVDDVKVNGKLTLGENTADNGGLRLAYIAFLEDAKRKSIDLEKQAGWLHAHPAILSGPRTELVRRHASRTTTSASANRSAFAATIPGERCRAEYARVWQSLRLQDRSTHDAGQCLQGVVRPGCRYDLKNKMEREFGPRCLVHDEIRQLRHGTRPRLLANKEVECNEGNKQLDIRQRPHQQQRYFFHLRQCGNCCCGENGK